MLYTVKLKLHWHYVLVQDAATAEKKKLDWEKRKSQSQTAGMREIKALIQEAERRRAAVKAGQTYVSHVTDCQVYNAGYYYRQI